ncbi:hypothetical protein [Dactylosporangium sp. CA-233914]|uniref:hypothetical protein n=1 Tax=Dactylosporangium sp. CA-233914 TaxID=3239934 RepID=UPI003D92E837
MLDGDFEIHLTLAFDPRLEAFAAGHGMKYARIVLDRGTTPDQPMLTLRCRGTLADAASAGRDWAARLAAGGYAVRRLKVEASPFNRGIPQSATDLPPGHYFEHHVKLVLASADAPGRAAAGLSADQAAARLSAERTTGGSPGDRAAGGPSDGQIVGGASGDLAVAERIGLAHGARLSRNARRDAGGGRHERFLTQRCRDCGQPEARERLAALVADLRGAGLVVAEVEEEYVAVDTDPSVDAGWLAA